MLFFFLGLPVILFHPRVPSHPLGALCCLRCVSAYQWVADAKQPASGGKAGSSVTSSPQQQQQRQQLLQDAAADAQKKKPAARFKVRFPCPSCVWCTCVCCLCACVLFVCVCCLCDVCVCVCSVHLQSAFLVRSLCVFARLFRRVGIFLLLLPSSSHLRFSLLISFSPAALRLLVFIPPFCAACP